MMNPSYSSIFQSISQQSQPIARYWERLANLRKSVEDTWSRRRWLRQRLSVEVLAARNDEATLQADIAALTEGLQVCQTQATRQEKELANWKHSRLYLEISLKERNVAALRFWGKTVEFGDLSDELLAVVLGCVDYVEQQRLTRVCRRWQYVLFTGRDHIYLDWPGIFCEPRLGDYRMFLDYYTRCSPVQLEIQPWQMSQHEGQQTRRLTIHVGFYHCNHAVFPGLLRLIQHFPNLNVLTLYKLPLDGLIGWMMYSGFADYWKDSPEIQVKLVDCVVSTLSVDNNLPRQLLMVNLTDIETYESVANVTLSDLDQLVAFLVDRRRIWPYPVEQLVWLKQYAPSLNQYPDAISALSTMNGVFSESLLCPLHQEMCGHLDQSFYDKISALGRNRIASLLLKFRPALVQPPPVPFGFKQLTYKGIRKVIVPVDL